MIIRKAKGRDLLALSDLLHDWLNETDFNYPGYCEYSNVWMATFLYQNFTLVAEVDGKIVGTIGLRYNHFPWNNEFYAFFCDFMIVDKDHRSGGTAQKLIEGTKELSDNTKTPIFLGIMTGNLADKKDRFLEMSGFKYAGGNFVYGV